MKTERLSVTDYRTGRKTDTGQQVGGSKVGKEARQAGRHRATSPASQQARGSGAAWVTNSASIWA